MFRYDIVKKLGLLGIDEKWRRYMRLSVQEKQEIIHLVDHSDLGVNRTLRQLGVNKSTFYKWYNAFLKKGTV